MPSSRLEKAEEAEVVKWCKDHDIIVWKLNVVGRRGLPDRIFLMPTGSKDPVVFIEFKREKGGRVSGLQLRTNKVLAARGIPCYIEYTAKAAIERLRSHLQCSV